MDGNTRLIALADAAKQVDGRPVSYATIRRWATIGLRGNFLEVEYVGGRVYVTREALLRFGAACTNSRRPRRRAEGQPSISREELRARFNL